MLTAWGDESGSQPAADPGTYILSAVLIEDERVEEIRATMSSLKLPGEKKLHWNKASDERRIELIECCTSLPLCGIVVVHNELGASDRRQRRKCLEHILPHLDSHDCETLTLESRSNADASDVDIIQKFRARGVLGAKLRIEHAIGRNEPVLAVADIVCGAVVQHRVGNPQYLAKLGGLIELRAI